MSVNGKNKDAIDPVGWIVKGIDGKPVRGKDGKLLGSFPNYFEAASAARHHFLHTGSLAWAVRA